MQVKTWLILLGLFLLAYLVVYPKYNHIRNHCSASGLEATETLSTAGSTTVYFPEIDRAVRLPQGGRPLVFFLHSLAAEVITFGKFDRKIAAHENLFAPFLKPVIAHWLNITISCGYNGTRAAVVFVATYLIEWLFMFIALLMFYLLVRQFGLTLAAGLSGISYLCLFTILHTGHPSRSTDISAIAGWLAIIYVFCYCWRQPINLIKTPTFPYVRCVGIFLIIFFVSFFGVLCRESAVAPGLLAAVFMLFAALKNKGNFKANFIFSLAFFIGSLSGVWFFLHWPQAAEVGSAAALALEKNVHMDANRAAMVSIFERFIFPFLPHIFLLIFVKSCRSSLSKYPVFFLFAFLAVCGNFLANFIMGAGLISEGLGQLAANVACGTLCFALIFNELTENYTHERI